MGIYYVGAASCVLERCPSLIRDASKICGASAGALMAAVVTLGLPLGELSLLTKFHLKICHFKSTLIIYKRTG